MLDASDTHCLSEPVIESLFHCAVCRKPFVPYGPRHTKTCGDSACRTTFVERNRTPAYRERAKARCRKHDAEKKGVKSRNPWLRGAPHSEKYMPGGIVTIDECRHQFRWPMDHMNIRGLHGLVTALVGEKHHPHFPNFSLFPIGKPNCPSMPWAIYFATDAGARLANRRLSGELFGRPIELKFSPLWRVKFPSPTGIKRGRSRLRIDTITPVLISNTNHHRDGQRNWCVRPTASKLQSALSASLLRRLALPVEPEPEAICVELIQVSTEPKHIDLGGKLYSMHGFSGSFEVEVNAVAHWLFKCTERIGFGARTAYGFGHIRVTELSR